MNEPITKVANAASLVAARDCGPLRRILHVLDHSWPVLDGYGQRSRSLLSAQLQLGFLPCVLTSPLHQQDDPSASEVSLDGIQYFRTLTQQGLADRVIRDRWPVLREVSVVRLLRRRIQSLLDSYVFDVVHSHSPALCGLASLQASRSRGIPFVYEIRSFWEDSDLDWNKTLRGSLRYHLSRGLETYVVRRAGAVVGIAHSILAELATRGVPADRLFHIPNGVDVSRFAPRSRDAALARELGIAQIPTLGYLGTFFPWEGVSWLVRAAAQLHQRGLDFRLLLIGDGAEAENIKRAIAENNCSEYVSYLGRIPHEQVERYYSLIDVLVYPRIRTRITEFVTPLKPLEAMALGKAVLGSDVGGIRELIDPEITGVLFKAGDACDFELQATRLLRDPEFRRSLGDRARQKVAATKDWKALARTYESVYAMASRSEHARG